MQLSDKRFWIFEAIILASTTMCIVIMWINHLIFLHLMVVVFYILFLVGGIIAWKLYKGNQWWKLAEYLFLITTAILSLGLFCFVWNWNDTGERPANIPPDVGTYITNNEFVGIIMLLWCITTPILSCVISYIAKRLLFKKLLSNNEK